MSEGFRHCFERDVTEGRSMSWYIDLGQPERIRVLGLEIAGANGRTISGNISSRIATGLGNRETYASPLPSVDLARQEPSNYG